MASKSMSGATINPKKRKDAPNASQSGKQGNASVKRARFDNSRHDARALSTQTSSKVFQNGALDVDKFVKAREFEILALEQGIQRSKNVLNQRAFQQVPRELRRRTASHDAKRTPKRLRAKVRLEMLRDATPLVNSRTRKPSSHKRLRLDTVKRLKMLGTRRKPKKANQSDCKDQKSRSATVQARRPRMKAATLATPPVPKAKFRKRQLKKAWLPTHVFHAKRAHMTPPSAPLWGFAIPLKPTQKSYRPTHRAAHDRGAVAWEMSYTSTIELEGREKSIQAILMGLCVDVNEKDMKIKCWKRGTRVLQAFLYEREAPHNLIAPAELIWCAVAEPESQPVQEERTRKRNMFIRVHPSAFCKVWTEMLRLSKIVKPRVTVRDLRYEIGSIEVTGPGSTEALLGALRPYLTATDNATSNNQIAADESVSRTWTSLAGLTNPSLLPPCALLGFTIQDPRLRHPPRTIKLPTSDEDTHKLLELIASWPIDHVQPRTALFDAVLRFTSSRLPSQKAIHRRKSAAMPGECPTVLPSDIPIPVIVFATPSSQQKKHASWTVLAPWKCITPIWYSILYYPLSTGETPKLAGLEQKRQLAFESGQPWFPADFPGTEAGWNWEVQERHTRKSQWARRPKAKRVAWDKLDLGAGQKGEVGDGWACAWELLLQDKPSKEQSGIDATIADPDVRMMNGYDEATINPVQQSKSKKLDCNTPNKILQVSTTKAGACLASSIVDEPATNAVVTVSLTLLTRGVPQACARVYKLPANPELRRQWLALRPSKQSNSASKRKKAAFPQLSKDAAPHLVHQRLANSLIEPAQAGDHAYPACPDVQDLIGFVTTGNFNLAEGKGIGIGCLALRKLVHQDAHRGSSDESRLCIVRNAGERVGRLAIWALT